MNSIYSSDCNGTRTHNHSVRSIQASIECGFTLKRVLCMVRTYSLFISLMTLNRVKLGHAVTFMKYLVSAISLIVLVKTLICNKIMFPASNSLNLAELVVSESMKSIYEKNYQYSFFYLIYRCLLQRIQELITKEPDSFTKILITIAFG